jgi:hypothetical protein
MTLPAHAVEDTNWLEPEDLYLQAGSSCETDRPLFQGDVFTGVPLPSLPGKPPNFGKVSIDFTESLAMLLPHPCQCYNGDRLRPRLTVAPVTEVPNYENFGADRDRAYDKFALPDLPVMREGNETSISHVASFGRLVTVPKDYLSPSNRMACLSHKGLGLLAKRVIRFQLRMPTELTATMAYTASQWNEAFLMQAWVRTHGTLEGFSNWMKSPMSIPSLDAYELVVPQEIVTGAVDVLLNEIAKLN